MGAPVKSHLTPYQLTELARAERCAARLYYGLLCWFAFNGNRIVRGSLTTDERISVAQYIYQATQPRGALVLN